MTLGRIGTGKRKTWRFVHEARNGTFPDRPWSRITLAGARDRNVLGKSRVNPPWYPPPAGAGKPFENWPEVVAPVCFGRGPSTWRFVEVSTKAP